MPRVVYELFEFELSISGNWYVHFWFHHGHHIYMKCGAHARRSVRDFWNRSHSLTKTHTHKHRRKNIIWFMVSENVMCPNYTQGRILWAPFWIYFCSSISVCLSVWMCCTITTPFPPIDGGTNFIESLMRAQHQTIALRTTHTHTQLSAAQPTKILKGAGCLSVRLR